MRRSIRTSLRLASPLTLVALAALLASTAATARDLEPYLFLAYRETDLDFRTGIACIQVIGVECPTNASTEDGDDQAWGLGLAARVSGPWWVELRYAEQETEARFFDPTGKAVSRPLASFDLSHLHAGVLYRFREGPWSPFLTTFAGVTQIDSEASTERQSEIDLEQASGGVGAGLLFDLGSRFGLRAEVRGIRTDMPGEFDGDLEQVQASAGLRLRI